MDFIISFVAQYLYVLVIFFTVIYLIVQYRSRWLELIISTIVIGGIAYLLSKITSFWISDPRPFIQTGRPPLIESALDNGFPSDHTLVVAAAAAIVTLVNWKVGLAIWVLALLIGLARVYAGVHHLLDIMGSIVLVILAMGLYLSSKRIWKYIGSKSSTNTK